MDGVPGTVEKAAGHLTNDADLVDHGESLKVSRLSSHTVVYV